MTRKPRILTLTCSFPNPNEPGHSPFVRARMLQVAKLADLVVVAPVPLVDYGNPDGGLFDSFRIPFRRMDGDVEVLHPKWFYPPLGTPWNIPCMYLRLLPLLARLGRRYRFDVIDSHFGYPDGVVATLLARHFRRPCLVTLRGNELANAEYRVRRHAMRWALRRTNRVITVSEELRRFAISQGQSPERVRTIPNGIDPEIFFPRDRKRARERYGISADEKVILSAGALIPRKGHHRIVRALGALRDRGLLATLLIAGAENRDGHFESEIRGVIEECGMNGQVRFLGFVPAPELAEVMTAADLLCLASSAEGWPNVVHESLACGNPVVATKVGAIPDLLPSEDYGIVVPLGDSRGLEDALGRGLMKQWDRTAVSAWGRARSWSQVAAEVAEEVRGVMGEAPLRP